MPEDGKTLLDFKVLSSLDDRVGSRRYRSHNSNDTPRLSLSLGIDSEQFFAAKAGSRSRHHCGSAENRRRPLKRGRLPSVAPGVCSAFVGAGREQEEGENGATGC